MRTCHDDAILVVDRADAVCKRSFADFDRFAGQRGMQQAQLTVDPDGKPGMGHIEACLLYTSDAADE